MKTANQNRWKKIFAVYAALGGSIILFQNFTWTSSFHAAGVFVSGGGIFRQLASGKVCGFRNLTEVGLVAGSWSFESIPTRTMTIDSSNYAGLCTGPDHLKYYGYYGNGRAKTGSESGDFMVPTQSHSNLVWIDDADESKVAQKLAKAQSLGYKAVVVVNSQFFDSYRTPIAVSIQRQRWNYLVQTIKPYMSTVAAFYPSDEPFLRVAEKHLGTLEDSIKEMNPQDQQVNRNQGNLSPASVYQYLVNVRNIIGETFPTIPVAIVFSYLEVKVGYLPPQNFDWIGVNCYGPFENCNGMSIPAYYERLKSMHPKARLILVPDANVKVQAYNATTERSLINSSVQYMTYAMNEPRTVAVVPFIYQSFCETLGPVPYDIFHSGNRGCYRGLEAMPTVADIFSRYGRFFARK